MHDWQRQDSSLTLAEGVAAYFASDPALLDGRAASAEAREFFRCHDAVHVVFGCGTSLPDEAIVKIASVFGTTAGRAALRGYRLHESRGIYRKLRLANMLRTTLESVRLVPRAILRCQRQFGKWPWDQFDRFLEAPLGKTRAEFGIHVAHSI
ncbi:MAG: hypothetical protein ABI589_15570 [Burkholderiales bacterium]